MSTSITNNKRLSDMLASTTILNLVLLLAIVAGIAFATLNLLYSRSVWLDEASLSLNFLDRSYADLLKPLDHRQVAPIGFLLLSKAIGGLANYQDLALRVTPFIFYLASVPLCWFFVLRLTGDRSLAYLTTALFSLNISIIQYASEIKQYSADVAITLAILAAALTPADRPHRVALLRGLVFAVSVWFSNVSIMIMALAGGYMLGERLFVKKRWPDLSDLAPYAAGLISFGVYYYFFIHDHPTREFMLNYWRRENAFFPSWRDPGAWPAYLADMTRSLFRYLFAYRYLALPGLLVLALGTIASLRRPAQLWFVLGVFFMHAALSSLELYPMARRLCLYMTPLICLQIATGVWTIVQLTHKLIPSLPAVVMLVPVLVLHAAIPVRALPTERYAMKKCLTHIEQSVQPGDTIFVHALADRPFRYYRRFYPGIDTQAAIVYGSRRGTNVQNLAKELVKVEGDRLWALFATHIGSREVQGQALLEAAREHGFDVDRLYPYRRSFSALLVRDDEGK
jgi:hypothetical protein